MCLYPKLVINRKYKRTKKNGGNPPPLLDSRVKYVPVACGNCIECRRAKANEWRIRLHEEIKQHKFAYFITLTFAPDKLEYLSNKYEINEVNELATKAVRLFLERHRKIYKKSIKHWFVTELGQEKTERIHIHGIIFVEDAIDNKWLEQLWSYGQTDVGKFCNSQTINYLVKYITKIDKLHKDYTSKICCSAGLGKNYINEFTKNKHRYNGKDTKEFYTLPDGKKLQLPVYYRNKLFTEKEREDLWINKIEKDTRYVNGIKIENVMKNEETLKYFMNALETAQKNNVQIGYGNDSKEWKKKEYLITLDMIKKKV